MGGNFGSLLAEIELLMAVLLSEVSSSNVGASLGFSSNLFDFSSSKSILQHFVPTTEVLWVLTSSSRFLNSVLLLQLLRQNTNNSGQQISKQQQISQTISLQSKLLVINSVVYLGSISPNNSVVADNTSPTTVEFTDTHKMLLTTALASLLSSTVSN